MADQTQSEIIKSKPTGDGLNTFRDSFHSNCKPLGIPSLLQALDQISDEGNTYGSLLETKPSALMSAVNSDDFDAERIKPLLNAVLRNKSDEVIWDKVYTAVTESTPPPRPLPSPLQTPGTRNTSSFANSSEHRKYVDDAMKEELGPLYVGVPGFFEAFFGGVPGLESAARAVFEKCKEGDNPQYSEESGWRDWPESAKEKEVLTWWAKLVDLLADLAEEHGSTQKTRRWLFSTA